MAIAFIEDREVSGEKGNPELEIYSIKKIRHEIVQEMSKLSERLHFSNNIFPSYSDGNNLCVIQMWQITYSGSEIINMR